VKNTQCLGVNTLDNKKGKLKGVLMRINFGVKE
jgi:hypothetical protein